MLSVICVEKKKSFTKKIFLDRECQKWGASIYIVKGFKRF